MKKLLKKLAKLAKKQGVTPGYILEKLIEDYLNRYNTN